MKKDFKLRALPWLLNIVGVFLLQKFPPPYYWRRMYDYWNYNAY